MRYHGAHPLSAKVEAGFCYIEVPHIHPTSVHKKHKSLYRDHGGHHSFVADPTPFGYDGPRHSYYGHHPVAVEVVLDEEPRYESGQQLEFCYLNGPHYHLFEPQPGLSFSQTAGASWYIGEFPSAYVEGKASYVPANRVYATLEVERPEVVFDAPPVGYVGPVLEVHVDAPVVVVPARADVHVDVGAEIHIPIPTIEIGFGIRGGIIDDGHHHHSDSRKHRGKKAKKHKKGKHKSKGRRRLRW